jgi:hypothetical protein
LLDSCGLTFTRRYAFDGKLRGGAEIGDFAFAVAQIDLPSLCRGCVNRCKEHSYVCFVLNYSCIVTLCVVGVKEGHYM